MLVGCLLQLLRESTQGNRIAPKPTLAAINQNHKLRLEVIKLLAAVGHSAGARTPAGFSGETLNLLLSDQQAREMRKIAARREAKRRS